MADVWKRSRLAARVPVAVERQGIVRTPIQRSLRTCFLECHNGKTEKDVRDSRMRFRRGMVWIAVAVLALVGVGVAQGNKPAPKMPIGKAFLAKVSQINLAEIELGKLAPQKGGDYAV